MTLRGRHRTTGKLTQADARGYADAEHMVPHMAIPISSADLCRWRGPDVLPIRRRNNWPIQWAPAVRSRDSDLVFEAARAERRFPAKTVSGREPRGVTGWTNGSALCSAPHCFDGVPSSYARGSLRVGSGPSAWAPGRLA